MSVSPNDLLSQAKVLVAGATSEIEFRNTIGRAYYAAYHAAKQFHDTLPTPGKSPPQKVGVHQELAHRLNWPGIPPSDPRFQRSQDIGRLLLWLHDKRVKADYLLDISIEQPDALEVIIRAERLMALAK